MTLSAQAQNVSAFASRDEAQAYLARALPRATAANPKFVTKPDNVETVWRTQSIVFTDSSAGGIQVAMDESFTETRGGIANPGTHRAVFSLAQVRVSPHVYPADVTPDGEKALGIIFTCEAGKCIQAVWNGAESTADATDISIQNDDERARILAAFEYLKSLSGAPKAPI